PEPQPGLVTRQRPHHDDPGHPQPSLDRFPDDEMPGTGLRQAEIMTRPLERNASTLASPRHY
ncbi:hypothetical protein, partial [Streptacidiphilus albus]|uniref:hypothetical protein n=1 Tax=Streptacidiphilus albus TaxID=105425 RepID=UPI001F37A54F